MGAQLSHNGNFKLPNPLLQSCFYTLRLVENAVFVPSD